MKRAILYGFVTAILILSSACSHQAQRGTYVWIDAPVNNLVLPEMQSVKIEGHAASPGGVTRVDVFIDGGLLTTLSVPIDGNDLAAFSTTWEGITRGNHVIQTVAYGSTGTTSEPDTVSITIGGETQQLISLTPEFTLTPTITPEISVTPTITPTYTSTPTKTSTTLPEAVILFWADPASIDAGRCTTLRWKVSNVSKVVFGGLEQPFTGSDDECLCEDRTYTLKVTLLDGTNVDYTADVNVRGTCVTEVPPDTTPPPVPVPQVPANSLSIACKASQSLVWLPVTDPSKIKEYQVRIQRSSDNINWSDLATSPITGLKDKTTTIPVECGWYYRWRVRAVDGVGNISDWSNWSTFIISLG